MKIAFTELDSPVVKEALNDHPDVTPVPASDLAAATLLVQSGAADSMVAGLNSPTREVVLACKAHLQLKSAFFSSCFVCKRDSQSFILADGGICKLPDESQLYTIVEDTAATYQTYFNATPRIAMLSYSSHGSGGSNNPDLAKIHAVIAKIRQHHPEYHIDGEMQLDTAINPAIGAKKFPGSEVAGHANILITPDLNSGNILYKSLEQFGGFTVAGPIIQGFTVPLADLSRGSNAADISLTIAVIKKLYERNRL